MFKHYFPTMYEMNPKFIIYLDESFCCLSTLKFVMGILFWFLSVQCNGLTASHYHKDTSNLSKQLSSY
jgi:hypothetical protein